MINFLVGILVLVALPVILPIGCALLAIVLVSELGEALIEAIKDLNTPEESLDETPSDIP